MTEPIQLDKLAELDKARVLEIINGLKINPIGKAIMLSQIRRASDAQIKAILVKAQPIITKVLTGDSAALDQLKTEIQGHAAAAHIPAAYVNGLIDLLKTEVSK